MKSIGVRILAGLITFLIGWSCAKLNFFLFSRPSKVDQSKAEKIFDDDSKVEYVEVVSRPDSKSSIPVFSWDVAPSSSFCKFKVLHRKDNVRIAWVSGRFISPSSVSA